jgi:hypothetical protein
VGRKKAVDKAKRAWWQVHVDAARESGLSGAAYCRKQGLDYSSFLQWRVALDEWEARKTEHRRRWKNRYKPISQDARRKATQAFWAMHVEAWTWSGLTLSEYATTFRLAPFSLRRWRNMLEAAEFDIDWRTMLHPSALPPIGTKISPRTNGDDATERLTTAQDGEARELPKRAARRTFTTEQKIAILLEADRPGQTISSVSRTHGIATSVLFRWRDQLGIGQGKPAMILPIRLVDNRADRSGPPSLLADLLPCPEGMQTVELADGRRVFAPAEADPDDVRREVAAQELQP